MFERSAGAVPVRAIHAPRTVVGWSDGWLLHDWETLQQLRLHLLEKLSERLATEGNLGWR
jgi:hypothetical protein